MSQQEKNNELNNTFKERKELNPRFAPMPILTGIDDIKQTCYERVTKGTVKYGIGILDDCVQGIRQGSVTYIVAAPNTGKSLFGLTIANALAKQGYQVLICSCEMGAGLLMERQLNTLAGVTMWQLTTLYEERKETAEKILDNILTNKDLEYLKNIFISETAGATIEDLLAMFDIYNEFDYIVVDYIQRIRGTGSEYEIITQASAELQRYARATNKKFIICSQASRQSNTDAKTGKQIQTDRLKGKGSGSIEEDADVGLSLLEDTSSEMQDGKRYILATIFKNRYGNLKNVTYRYELTKRMTLVRC